MSGTLDDNCHPRRSSRAYARIAIVERRAKRRTQAKPPGRFDIDVWFGLAALDLIDTDQSVNASPKTSMAKFPFRPVCHAVCGYRTRQFVAVERIEESVYTWSQRNCFSHTSVHGRVPGSIEERSIEISVNQLV
jgi:hypothetical protein